MVMQPNDEGKGARARIQELPLDEDLTIGVDIGIGSCAFAAISSTGIEKLAVRCFPVPETDDKKELLNKIRRDNRLLRRVTHRRRLRRNRLAEVLSRSLKLSKEQVAARDGHDPWRLRAEGLDRVLSADELAAALMHIAKRRGFQSNSKKTATNKDPEGKKALQGANAMREKSQKYRTIGEMLYRDPALQDRKRNRTNDYSHTLYRDDLRAEVRTLFEAQRRLGSKLVSTELEQEFSHLAFTQRPLQPSEKLLGACPFEPDQRRSSAYAPGIERFRYLQKLVNLSLVEGKATPHPLSAEQLTLAAGLFGRSKTITYKALRKALALDEDQFGFAGVPRQKPPKGSLYEGSDICLSRGSCAGTITLEKVLRPVLGDVEWNRQLADTEILDRVADILTFREAVYEDEGSQGDSIEYALKESAVPEDWHLPLLKAAEEGVFADFKGAAAISALAARRIAPGLEKGMKYDAACQACGYDHAQQSEPNLSDIRNPVVYKVLKESERTLKALVESLGRRPGRISLEMARDVGKPKEVRQDIERFNQKRKSEKEDLREEIEGYIGRAPAEDELIALQLWKEQGHCCIYSGASISPRDLDLRERKLEIDHVLPRSRSQDNSYHNKVLCLTNMNQAKGNRTPYEWLCEAGGHPKALGWEEFEVWVESQTQMRGMKKGKLLHRTFSARENAFVERNLNDTRYASRVFRRMLEDYYRDERAGHEGRKPRRVFTRPGNLTAIVRRAWGLDRLKKDSNGQRRGDLHHAVDAAVLATLGADEALTQELTRIHQKLEGRGLARDIDIDPPWPEFAQDLESQLRQVFVSRPERRKGTGEAHHATIRRYRVEESEDGGKETVIYERKAVDKLTEKDLEKLDPTRQADLISVLQDWMQQDKKQRASCPRMPLKTKDGEGPEIRQVRLPVNKESGIQVRGGLAYNGDMRRVDVFRKNGKFWLVPIYVHHIGNKQAYPKPPNKACTRGKPFEEWEVMDEVSEFLFSLYPGSYLRLVGKNEINEGYYRGMNIFTASVALSPQEDSSKIRGLGVKNLASLEKYYVDLLGQKFPIEKEPRLWHGEVCT